MAFESNTGIDVSNHYGPRFTGGSVGVEHSSDSKHRLTIYLTKDNLGGEYVPPVVIPAGVQFISWKVAVDEAFAGTTAITIGEKGAESTNGVPLVAGDINSTGTRDITGPATGTWLDTSHTTTATQVGITHTGAPTAGRATVILEFVNKAR